MFNMVYMAYPLSNVPPIIDWQNIRELGKRNHMYCTNDFADHSNVYSKYKHFTRKNIGT